MSSVSKISVVMAAYNGDKFIGEQINSLLKFLGAEDELIVSDDASTDSTKEVVESIGDERVILLPIGRRLGYQKNFEKAISYSSGEFIFFADQDDICLPERFEKSILELKSFGCVIGDAVLVDEFLCKTNESFFDLRKCKKISALRIFIRPVAIGATMACTRKFLQSALPFPAGVPHDQWLSLVAAARGNLSVVRTPFILYRRHASVASVTGTNKKRSFISIVLSRLRLFFAFSMWLYRS